METTLGARHTITLPGGAPDPPYVFCRGRSAIRRTVGYTEFSKGALGNPGGGEPRGAPGNPRVPWGPWGPLGPG